MCFMALLCAVHNYDVARAADSMYDRSSSEHFAIKGVDEPLPSVPLLHKAPTQGRHEWKLTRDGLLPFSRSTSFLQAMISQLCVV